MNTGSVVLLLAIMNVCHTMKVKYHNLLLPNITEDCIKETHGPLSCNSFSLYRTINGVCNNLRRVTLGAVDTPAKRILNAKYFDAAGLNKAPDCPRIIPPYYITTLPTAQEVTNAVFIMLNNSKDGTLSSLHPYFGQFLDHDITLTKNKELECHVDDICANKKCFQAPRCPIFNKQFLNDKCFDFTRSTPICSPHTTKVRTFANSVTSFIDGSMVYGSTDELALRLRGPYGLLDMQDYDSSSISKHVGKKSLTKLLPNNKDSKDACFSTDNGGCFLAGDVRVNEHIALSSLHTLFALEHNRIAKKLKSKNKRWTDDKIFNEARKIVGAIMQNIVYNEYLPLLGIHLQDYNGYDEYVDPRISMEFNTAAFRFGHSQVKDTFTLIDNKFKTLKKQSLRNTFFNTTLVRTYGVQSILLGLTEDFAKNIDTEFARDIGEKLHIPEGKSGFRNLAALNIQRGRDHGLPSYVDLYKKYTGIAINSFDDFVTHQTFRSNSIATNLRIVYRNILGDIDLFAAGMAEKPIGNGLLGPTFTGIIKDQFKRLRDGDRYFYKRNGVFTTTQLREIENVRFNHLFCDNFKITKIRKHILRQPGIDGNRLIDCVNICDSLNFEEWREY